MCAHNPSHPAVSRPLQRRFLAIPQAPLCYWLRDRFFDLLAGRTLDDVADVCQGLATGDDDRFVRFVWEMPTAEWARPVRGRRWVPFEKGGGYGKWFGHHFWAVDWDHDGARLKRVTVERYGNAGKRVYNEDRYFGSGWTYSYMARGSVGLRWLDSQAVFSHLAPAVLPRDATAAVAATANGRFASLTVRALSGKIQLNESYVARIPVLSRLPHRLAPLESVCVSLKRELVSSDLAERTFLALRSVTAGSLGEAAQRCADRAEVVATHLHTLEALADRDVLVAYGIAGEDLTAVLEETGTPAGWYPLIAGYDAVPVLPEAPAPPLDLLEPLAGHQRLQSSDIELTDLKARLRALYEAGPGEAAAVNELGDPGGDDGDTDDDTSSVAGAYVPIPAETFLEELAGELEIHPISVYWLLRELREREGVVCWSERQRFVEDYVSVVVLQLLGHQWPREVESGEPRPPWAEENGIILITESSGERSLLTRVRERLAADFGDENVNAVEREFQDIVGQSLAEWLVTEFFVRHVSQFRKRPIAWQIQSTPAAVRRRRGTAPPRPVFACLVYHHKVDGHLVPNLRTRHVGALRGRMQTELAGLEQGGQRSGEQEGRRVQIEEAIRELQEFDHRLEQIAREGFGGVSMRGRLRQHAIDDGFLALRARWLRRLSEAAAAGPLSAWLAAAHEAHIDDRLAGWIQAAISALPIHCSSVGPSAPDEVTLADDPATPDLAGLISADWKGMTAAALGLACDRWSGRLTAEVFAPLRESIAAIEREVKRLVRQAGGRRNVKHLPADDREQVRAREEEVKVLRTELEDKRGRAGELRKRIEGWSCDEAAGWGAWLAWQPLYDEASAGAAHRPPPPTVDGFVLQEASYLPDVNDGVRVNLAPFQRAGVLAADVLPTADLDRALAERAQWRADDRRWCRESRLPRPGWLADA